MSWWYCWTKHPDSFNDYVVLYVELGDKTWVHIHGFIRRIHIHIKSSSFYKLMCWWRENQFSQITPLGIARLPEGFAPYPLSAHTLLRYIGFLCLVVLSYNNQGTIILSTEVDIFKFIKCVIVSLTAAFVHTRLLLKICIQHMHYHNLISTTISVCMWYHKVPL